MRLLRVQRTANRTNTVQQCDNGLWSSVAAQGISESFVQKLHIVGQSSVKHVAQRVRPEIQFSALRENLKKKKKNNLRCPRSRQSLTKLCVAASSNYVGAKINELFILVFFATDPSSSSSNSRCPG